MSTIEITWLNRQKAALHVSEDLKERVIYTYEQLGFDNTTPFKDFIQEVMEKAVQTVQKNKASQPADLEKIEKLEKEVERQKALAEEYQGKLDKLKTDNEYLNGQLTKKEELIEELENTGLDPDIVFVTEEDHNNAIQLKDNEIGRLEMLVDNLKQKTQDPNDLTLHLSSAEMEIVGLITEKFSRIKKQEVTPHAVLMGLTLSYYSKHYVEIPGFPLIVSESEIKAIAAKHKKQDA